MYKAGFFETIIYRFEVLLNEQGGGDSVSGRIDRMTAAVAIYKEHPFLGGGIGSFPLNYNGIDAIDYPHNILLEFLSEFGILGLLVLSIFFTLVVWMGIKVYKSKNNLMDSSQVTLLSLFIYFFLNSMVSGDVNGNRLLFFFATCLLISPYLKYKIGSKGNQENITLQ